MGYTTYFEGFLFFNSNTTAKELSHLSTFLGEDTRDHPEWNAPDDFYRIDLEITDDFSGLRHTGAEKTYGMVEMVNFIIDKMKEKFPDFELQGEFTAQGEEFTDRWSLLFDENGKAYRKDYKMVGDKVVCPHCGESFAVEHSDSD